MKGKFFKAALCSVMAFGVMVPNSFSVYASNVDLKDNLKDHWSFDSLTSDQGTLATLSGSHVKVVDSGNDIFGKVLRFGEGANNFMRLENYINTGEGATSFSMWYKYDNSITETNSSEAAVLLQHEGTGKSLLTLKADGKYNTFINGENKTSTTAIQKDKWQHITVAFDQNKKEVSYYVNGELDSTQKMGNGATKGILSLRLGAHKEKDCLAPHPMRGDVDEFYVYNKALNKEEAKAVYEDKAKDLFNRDLKKLIDEAQKIYDSHQLDKNHESAKNLANKIEVAKKAITFDQMKQAYNDLNLAIKLYQSEIPIHLNVDLNKVNRTIESNSIFGINHRYAFNGYGTFDSKEMKMKDEFTALYKDAGFGSIRYPGGTISNLFNWKTTLGETKNRKNQIHGFYNNPNQGGIKPNFGIKEIADFADNVNSEIVYVYSLGRGNAQDAADLVEYLNAKVGTNPNGGIDWAQVRANNGHKEPYNVRYFEIGNEMQQWSGEDGRVSQGYWTSYVNGGAEDAYIKGGTAKFDKFYTVKEEDWNEEASRSDGSKNQVRYLRYANTNPGKLEDGKIVADSQFQAMEKNVRVFAGPNRNNVAEWEVKDTLANSGPTDRHCVVDYTTGAIKFGDGVNGKIPENGNGIYATYQVKREGFLNVSEAIKKTTDQINKKENKNLKANVYSSFESESFIQKMKNLNKNDLYDGLTIHPYSGTVENVSTPENFYDEVMKKAEHAGIDHVRKYARLLPNGKVPVISEYGIFRNTQEQVRSQTHAVYIAKVLMEYVKLGSPYIQKHCLTDWYSSGADSLGPTQQAVIQVVPQAGADTKTGEGQFKFFSTPSAHVFKMLNSGFGDEIIDATLEHEPTMSNGVTTLSTLASKDNDGNIYIAMVNVDREKDQSVQLNILGYDLDGRTIEIQMLSSQSITDENTLKNPNNVAVKESKIVATNNQVIKLPKHSFVKIKIVNKIDKSSLQNKVDEINSLNKDHYTHFESMNESLNNAVQVLNNKYASLKDVENALQALVDAQNALVLKKADYTKVDEAVAEVEKLNKKDYEDFTAVEQALRTVIRDLDITKQSEVDKMAENIYEAIKNLKLIDHSPVVPDKPNDVDKPSDSNNSNGSTKPSTPTTSDTTQFVNLFTGMIVAFGGIYMTFRKSKKDF